MKCFYKGGINQIEVGACGAYVKGKSCEQIWAIRNQNEHF